MPTPQLQSLRFDRRNPLSRPFGSVSPAKPPALTQRLVIWGQDYGAYVWALDNARGRKRALIECVPQNAMGLRFTGHTLSALVGCATSRQSLRTFRLSPEKPALRPFGYVSSGKGSTFYAGSEVPLGLCPKPRSRRRRARGCWGEKLPNTPGREAIWWGGSQEQSAFGGPADAEPQRGPPPFFLTVRIMC